MRSLFIYAVLTPVVAVALFLQLIPKTGSVFGRPAGGDGSAALVSATASMYSVADTSRALDDAFARADSRARAREHEAALNEPQRATTRAGQPIDRFSFVVDTGISEKVRALVEKIARQEAPSPQSKIAIITMIDPYLFFPRYRRLVVLPATPDGPCTVVLRLSFRFPVFNGTGDSDRLLGTCAFYAKFGAPGRGMRDWLESTGLRSAGYLQPPASHGVRAELTRMDVSSLGRIGVVAACRAKRPGACDRLFDAEETATPSAFGRPLVPVTDLSFNDVSLSSPFTHGSPTATVGTGLLASLAADLGDDRFSTLWRADTPLRETFERSEGRPLAAWVESFVEARMYEYHAGPSPTNIQWAAILIVFGIALSMALRSPRQLT